MRMRELESLVAWHCAATLLGEKAGSMFTLRWERYHALWPALVRLREALKQRGVALRVFGTRAGALIYLYRPGKLWEELATEPARAILLKCGYSENALSCLQTRLLSFREFPHEIGLFLGYPAQDVAGFIEHGGTNPLFSGLWKVYHDAEKARSLFCAYRQCRERMLSLLDGGMSLQEILSAA
jgi:hypothetical protein